MMNPKAILLTVVFALVTVAARADWTAQIPSPTNKVTTLRAGTRFGVALGLGSGLGDLSLERVVWFARDGSLLLDYRIPDGEMQVNLYDGHGIHMLNSRQILLVDSAWPRTNHLFRLITVGTNADFTVRDYSVSGRVDIDYWQYPAIEADTTGFYILDDKNNLIRVDFPIPAGSQSTKLTIQSGTEPAGPWTDISDTILPADKPSEFFRLKASKP